MRLYPGPLLGVVVRVLVTGWLASLLVVGCGGSDQVSGGDAGEVDGGGADADLPLEHRDQVGEHPKVLPFEYLREDAGDPLTAAEVTSFTERYLELLEHTRYFETIADRVHGWPRSDPQQRYWYGTWWSGVRVIKEIGQVTFLHGAAGADNNGLRTAQIMESTCYAFRLWTEPELEQLLRTLIRGFSSWILAMESSSHPDAGVLMTRASYPEPVLSADRAGDIWIDYGLNRPGEPNGATTYVHVPDNPYWGDIWVKNKRSKDDIGAMLRSIAQVDACTEELGDPARDDLDLLYGLYFRWARRVVDDWYGIATYDEDLNVFIPNEGLANYVTVENAECSAMLALNLAGRAHPGGVECGSGIAFADWAVAELNNSSAQIIRTHHEAAANHALLANRPTLALDLLGGLAERITHFFDAFQEGTQPQGYSPGDYAALMMHSANVGVPLTSQEIRWLMARFDLAHASYLNIPPETFDIFSPATPDGEYPFEPGGDGVFFNDLGLLLGACTSQWRNPSARPILDCDRVRDWR